jgi:hypothetical protein
MYEGFTEEINPRPSERNQECHKLVRETIQPVEFTGKTGDVLFWHNRMIHSSGLNFGGSVRADGSIHPPRVRIAAIQDYQRVRAKTWLKYGGTPLADGSYTEFGPDADPATPVQMQWHHDALELAPERPIDTDDMWSGWNLGKTPVSASPGVADLPYWHKYGLVDPTVPLACGIEGPRPLSAIAVRDEDGVWRQRRQILPA